jgi:predicted TIM-barrel fold metal-dependent hydrolase
MEVIAMNSNASDANKVVDAHCHVGLLGDEYPQWGHMSGWYRKQTVYKAFLIYGRMDASNVSDRTLRDATEQAIGESKVDHVVCLALDPVYDQQGQRREDLSHMWVDNDYILDLRQSLGDKVLLGASVHPYDPKFKDRVRTYVEKGAVLLKWLPSAQQVDLADERIQDALTFLATARGGKPLPLLLHNGPEYAIPSSDPRTSSYDCLRWTWWDRFWNSLRGSKMWYRPRPRKIHRNLRAGLEAGATIIFAHCGLPYYAPHRLSKFLEHSEFRTVSRYLRKYPVDNPGGGRCYADVSAIVTPFRRSYFEAIKRLPPQSLLFGSDFPTPVFELSANLEEVAEDFRAVMAGQWDRVVVPQDNLIDVNYRELQHFFPGHPMFTNFNALL